MAYVTKEDVYRVSGLPSDGSVVSDNDIEMHIEAAEAYVEQFLGTCFQSGGRSKTETYDGDGTDTLFLDHYPIISLDSLTIDSTSVTTSLVYTWAGTGKLQLKNTAEVTTFKDNYPQLISVTYTYGEAPHERVKHFTSMVAATMAFIGQIGGTFDDVTSFELPELSGSLGEPYTNIREALNQMRNQMNMYLEKGWVRIKPQFG